MRFAYPPSRCSLNFGAAVLGIQPGDEVICYMTRSPVERFLTHIGAPPHPPPITPALGPLSGMTRPSRCRIGITSANFTMPP